MRATKKAEINTKQKITKNLKGSGGQKKQFPFPEDAQYHSITYQRSRCVFFSKTLYKYY